MLVRRSAFGMLMLWMWCRLKRQGQGQGHALSRRPWSDKRFLARCLCNIDSTAQQYIWNTEYPLCVLPLRRLRQRRQLHGAGIVFTARRYLVSRTLVMTLCLLYALDLCVACFLSNHERDRSGLPRRVRRANKNRTRPPSTLNTWYPPFPSPWPSFLHLRLPALPAPFVRLPACDVFVVKVSENYEMYASKGKGVPVVG